MVEHDWETVPCSRSTGAKATVSKLGSCARLHVGSCVSGSKSRTTAGLCNCSPATVVPGWGTVLMPKNSTVTKSCHLALSGPVITHHYVLETDSTDRSQHGVHLTLHLINHHRKLYELSSVAMYWLPPQQPIYNSLGALRKSYGAPRRFCPLT